MEKKQLLQQMLLGKMVIGMQKTETRSMSFTLYKYQPKCIKDLNLRCEALKTVQERTGHALRVNRHSQ
jgi:hypothetical protein